MKKKISILITIFISMIALYTILWYGNSQLVFSKYEKEDFQESPVGSGKIKKIGEYVLIVKKPDYGTFTGNLGITGQNSNVSIIIWPSLFKDTNYGLIIGDGEEVSHIEVDEKFSVLDKNNTVAQQLIEKNWDELLNQRKIIYENWGILGDELERGKN